MPKAYFDYFTGRINLNSVREVCYKAQPCYQGTTMNLSYKIWNLDKFLDALEENEITSLNTDVLFSGNEQCEEEANCLQRRRSTD